MVADENLSDKIALAITQGKFNLALKYLKPQLDKDEDNVSLLLDYGYICTNLQKFDEAISAYTKVTEQIPDSPSGYAGLGFAYRINGENEEAIKYFQKGIEFAPDNAMLYFELGETYFEIDLYEDALKSYYKAVQFGGVENETEILHRIAQVHLGMDEPKKAIEIAENVLKKDPSYLSIYNILGVAAYLEERWVDASEHFKKYLEIAPDDEAAQNLLKEIEGNIK